MNGLRTFHACLEASVRDQRCRVVPIRPHLAAPAAIVYGAAHRLKPVFTEGLGNACPCCNGRAWHVGRITAECAICETVLPVVKGSAFRGTGQ